MKRVCRMKASKLIIWYLCMAPGTLIQSCHTPWSFSTNRSEYFSLLNALVLLNPTVFECKFIFQCLKNTKEKSELKKKKKKSPFCPNTKILTMKRLHGLYCSHHYFTPSNTRAHQLYRQTNGKAAGKVFTKQTLMEKPLACCMPTGTYQIVFYVLTTALMEGSDIFQCKSHSIFNIKSIFCCMSKNKPFESQGHISHAILWIKIPFICSANQLSRTDHIAALHIH